MPLSPFLVCAHAHSRALSTTSAGSTRVEKEQIFWANLAVLPSSQGPLARIRFVPKTTHDRSGESVGGSSEPLALPDTPERGHRGMKEWIVCEDNCLKCSYGATLDCDGDCPRCPRNMYGPGVAVGAFAAGQ